MANPEQRYERMRQQVNAKILWGARDEEVREWLAQKWGIIGGVADVLLDDAHKAKRAAVRKRAIVWLIFSGIGVALAAGFYGFQYYMGIYYVGTGPAAIAVGSLACLGRFLGSLWQLLSGRMEGSAVD